MVAVVGNKRAAQRVVVGLITGLNWTELVEMLIGSHLKIVHEYVKYVINTIQLFIWFNCKLI